MYKVHVYDMYTENIQREMGYNLYTVDVSMDNVWTSWWVWTIHDVSPFCKLLSSAGPPGVIDCTNSVDMCSVSYNSEDECVEQREPLLEPFCELFSLPECSEC